MLSRFKHHQNHQSMASATEAKAYLTQPTGEFLPREAERKLYIDPDAEFFRARDQCWSRRKEIPELPRLQLGADIILHMVRAHLQLLSTLRASKASIQNISNTKRDPTGLHVACMLPIRERREDDRADSGEIKPRSTSQPVP